MKFAIRPAVAADAEALLAIYAPIVRDTTISFETTVPSVADFAARIASALAAHQWLVAETPQGLIGYAYGTSHRARAAYRFAAETSVYVADNAHGLGVARALYSALFDDLVALGYYHAYAGITMPNQPSVGLHAAMGFSLLGQFPNVGFKQGRWHDVSWWYRPLQTGVPQREPGRLEQS